MNIFIQMGSSKYIDPNLVNFNNKTKYFWEQINRKGYFHIASSKPEHLRSVVNVFKKNNKFFDLKKCHTKELKNYWMETIKKLESIRWKKAYGFFLIGNKGKSLKQLYLLKHTMSWKHKYLKPNQIIEGWTKKANKKMLEN